MQHSEEVIPSGCAQNLTFHDRVRTSVAKNPTDFLASLDAQWCGLHGERIGMVSMHVSVPRQPERWIIAFRCIHVRFWVLQLHFLGSFEYRGGIRVCIEYTGRDQRSGICCIAHGAQWNVHGSKHAIQCEFLCENRQSWNSNKKNGLSNSRAIEWHRTLPPH